MDVTYVPIRKVTVGDVTVNRTLWHPMLLADRPWLRKEVVVNVYASSCSMSLWDRGSHWKSGVLIDFVKLEEGYGSRCDYGASWVIVYLSSSRLPTTSNLESVGIGRIVKINGRVFNSHSPRSSQHHLQCEAAKNRTQNARRLLWIEGILYLANTVQWSSSRTWLPWWTAGIGCLHSAVSVKGVERNDKVSWVYIQMLFSAYFLERGNCKG